MPPYNQRFQRLPSSREPSIWDQYLGEYPAKTAWEAPTYQHWYPYPFGDPYAGVGGISPLEKLMDPGARGVTTTQRGRLPVRGASAVSGGEPSEPSRTSGRGRPARVAGGALELLRLGVSGESPETPPSTSIPPFTERTSDAIPPNVPSSPAPTGEGTAGPLTVGQGAIFGADDFPIPLDVVEGTSGGSRVFEGGSGIPFPIPRGTVTGESGGSRITVPEGYDPPGPTVYREGTPRDIDAPGSIPTGEYTVGELERGAEFGWPPPKTPADLAGEFGTLGDIGPAPEVPRTVWPAPSYADWNVTPGEGVTAPLDVGGLSSPFTGLTGTEGLPVTPVDPFGGYKLPPTGLENVGTTVGAAGPILYGLGNVLSGTEDPAGTTAASRLDFAGNMIPFVGPIAGLVGRGIGKLFGGGDEEGVLGFGKSRTLAERKEREASLQRHLAIGALVGMQDIVEGGFQIPDIMRFMTSPDVASNLGFAGDETAGYRSAVSAQMDRVLEGHMRRLAATTGKSFEETWYDEFVKFAPTLAFENRGLAYDVAERYAPPGAFSRALPGAAGHSEAPGTTIIDPETGGPLTIPTLRDLRNRQRDVADWQRNPWSPQFPQTYNE